MNIKRIAMVSTLALVTFVIVANILLEKKKQLAREIIQQANEYGVEIDQQDIHLSFLPNTYIKIVAARYHRPEESFFLHFNLKAEIAFISLFKKDIQIKAIEFEDINLTTNTSANELNNDIQSYTATLIITPKDDQFYQHLQNSLFNLEFVISNRSKDQLSVSADVNLSHYRIDLTDVDLALQFARPQPFIQNQHTAKISSAVINYFTHQKIYASFNDVMINGVNISRLKADLWQQNALQNAKLVGYFDNYDYLEVDGSIYNHQWQLHFNSPQLQVQKIFYLLGMEPVIYGNMAIGSELNFSHKADLEGSLHYAIDNGKLNYINFFSMLANYLPINFDKEKLIQNSSAFTRLSGEIAAKDQFASFNAIQFVNNDLEINGSGTIDLKGYQCDFNLLLASIKHTEIRLPIRIFDDCRSPNYEIVVNKLLKKKLSEFIKKKLKRKQQNKQQETQ